MNKHGAQNTGKTIKRILSYMKKYKFRFIFVLICILLSAVANVAGSMFIGTLIDDYITPLLGSTNPVFTGLLKAICVMGIVYLVGILATLFYNRTMVSIAQGVLKKIRDDMFTHMQKLPIKYFDTHTHGDIMSYYTNDTDTLRQMMAQSIPQIFSSAVTIISVVVAMFISNVYLAIFVLVFATCMMFVIKKIAGASGRFFVKQQQSIGKVNGYIEEMINGQKVVKVFCHEEHSKEDFDKNEWTIIGEPDTTLVINRPATVELTCASIVNRIPDVINAKPGYVPTEQMGELNYRTKPLNEYVK